MKLVQVAEQNKKYYTKEFIHGFNTGAKTQLEADKKNAERKGHWIGERLIYPSGIITFIYRCSECGCEERHAYEDTKPSNYCPDCGTRMEAKENEND